MISSYQECPPQTEILPSLPIRYSIFTLVINIVLCCLAYSTVCFLPNQSENAPWWITALFCWSFPWLNNSFLTQAHLPSHSQKLPPAISAPNSSSWHSTAPYIWTMQEVSPSVYNHYIVQVLNYTRHEQSFNFQILAPPLLDSSANDVHLHVSLHPPSGQTCVAACGTHWGSSYSSHKWLLTRLTHLPSCSDFLIDPSMSKRQSWRTHFPVGIIYL